MLLIMNKSTIVVKSETRTKLKQLGRKGETYDQIICELLKEKDGLLQANSLI